MPGSSEAEKWFNKYLAPYMKIIKTETLSDGSLMAYFPDGSALRTLSHTTRDWVFFPGNQINVITLTETVTVLACFILILIQQTRSLTGRIVTIRGLNLGNITGTARRNN